MKSREQFLRAYGIRLNGKNHFRLLALLLCLEVVLAFSAIGFIELPPISLTTLSIFVIVAAMYFGPAEAVAVSLVFAASSMWKASLTSVEEGDIIFSPTLSGKPVETILMALAARVVFALVAGLLFRWFFSRERKNRELGIAVISVVSTGVHALLIYVCMVSFFGASDVETGSGFWRALLVNNLILYAVTVLVVIGCDLLVRSKAVGRFISVTSEKNAPLTKNQKTFSVTMTVITLVLCVLLCLHFLSRLVGYISAHNLFGGGDNSWIVALLMQFLIGFAAAFAIIAVFLRWMQEYFSTVYADAEENEHIREELIQNNARIFALEDDFESLYDVEMISGRYVSYVKGDFYQGSVADKLVQPTDYFDDLRANIDAVIYPEDRDGLYNILTREAIRRELSENDHFDYFYRINTENGPMWFKIRVVYKDVDKKNVIIGVFNAEEEMAEKEKNSRMMNAFASDNEVSVLFDLRTGGFTLLSNKGKIPDQITGLLDHEESYLKYAEGFVHPDDRANFYSDLYTAEGIKSRLSVGESCSFDYRGRVDAEYAWYRALFNRISEDEVIIGYRNCDEEIVNRQVSEKVIADFASVFIVNINSDSYRFFSRNSESGFADVPGGVYSETIREYITRVNPAYRERWYKVSDPASVRELLKKEDRVEYVYPLEGIEKRWRRCILQTLERENGIPISFIMTYFVINETTAENLELSAKLAEQKASLEESLTFTNFFLDTYVSAYYVNLDNYSCQVYKRTEDLEQNYPIITNYLESITDYINTDVHPEDRAEMHEVIKPENMRRLLQEQPEYNHIFRDISGGIEKTYRMQVIRGSEESHAAFGFIDITEEIIAQRNRLQEEEDARKLVESIAASYNIAYVADLNDGSIKLIRVDENVIREDQVFESFAAAKESFLSILPDSDRERMSRELDLGTIREKLAGTSSYTVEYRVPVNGAIFWHEMNITSIDSDHVAMGFTEKDLEITQKHLEDKRFSEYFALYEIDLDTGMLKIVKDSPWYEIDRAGTAMPYVPAMLKFASGLDDEPRAFFEQLADLEYVRSQFAAEDKRTYAYRSNNVGEKDWVDCTSYVTMRHSDGTPAMVTFGFSMIDSLGVYRQELQSRVTENMQMIGGLADRYDTLYYVNIDQNVFKIYAFDGEKYPETSNIISGETDPFETVRRFGSSPIVHPDDHHLFADLSLESVRERLAHSKKFSFRYRQADGGDFVWFEMEVVKYEDVDEPANALAIGFTNRDAEIRAEQEYQQELKNAREAADAANESKSNFLFNMSHDIRTPMNAIRGFTAMAKKHADDEQKVSEYLEKIDISGQQLLTLINQVLEMARIESGKVVLEEQQVDIREEFNSMVTVLSEQADANGLEFIYSLSNLEHNNVFADEARMSSVTLNITGNAMKYTPEGGTVEFHLREIPERKPGFATFVFTVADTGIGMSKEFLGELYEPFSREKNSTVSKIQGTGLGLSIVKSIVDLMGGNIEVQSEPGKGTRFDVTVDFRINENASSAEDNTDSIGALSFEGRRVLLVEDNEMNREIARDLLEEQGLIVEDAEDGDVAVSMVRKTFDCGEFSYYDFILMDIQMPRMNGYEATKKIRAMESLERVHIPIIAMTANAFEEDRQNALAAGMDEHLAKPIDVQKMFRTIAKYL